MGRRSSSSSRPTSARTSAGARPTRPSSSSSATTGSAGSSGRGRPGGGGGGANFSGAAGILRLFNAEFGGQIAWFIPFALIALASGLWIRRRSRPDRRRARRLPPVGRLVRRHALVFSFMSGIVHTYYAVALAPAIAALVGAGAVDLWRLRERTRFGGLAPRRGGPRHGLAGLSSCSDGRPTSCPGSGIGVLVVGISVAVVLALPMAAAGRRPSLAAAGAGGGRPAGRSRGLRRRHDGVGAQRWRSVGWSGGRRRAGRRPVAARGAAAGVHPARQRPGRHRTGRRRPRRVRRWPGAGSVDQAAIDYLVANRGDATWLVAAARFGQRRLDRAGDRPAGHGDGRLHGLGPHPDPRRAPGLHRVRPAPVRRPRRRRRTAGWRRLGRGERAERLGPVELHGRRPAARARARRSTTARARSSERGPGRCPGSRERGPDQGRERMVVRLPSPDGETAKRLSRGWSWRPATRSAWSVRSERPARPGPRNIPPPSARVDRRRIERAVGALGAAGDDPRADRDVGQAASVLPATVYAVLPPTWTVDVVPPGRVIVIVSLVLAVTCPATVGRMTSIRVTVYVPSLGLDPDRAGRCRRP